MERTSLILICYNGMLVFRLLPLDGVYYHARTGHSLLVVRGVQFQFAAAAGLAGRVLPPQPLGGGQQFYLDCRVRDAHTLKVTLFQ